MDFFRYFIGEFEAVFAGKPAPTVNRVYTAFVYDLNPCGSGLAREEAIHYTADFATDGLGRIEHRP
ncbi:hypothetical protein HNR03_003102 [Pseudomonas sp. JAI111]|nr:hypothetical protein [Pseudomonas sp. JAI111]